VANSFPPRHRHRQLRDCYLQSLVISASAVSVRLRSIKWEQLSDWFSHHAIQVSALKVHISPPPSTRFEKHHIESHQNGFSHGAIQAQRRKVVSTHYQGSRYAVPPYNAVETYCSFLAWRIWLFKPYIYKGNSAERVQRDISNTTKYIPQSQSFSNHDHPPSYQSSKR
jgi:hypothetical protein